MIGCPRHSLNDLTDSYERDRAKIQKIIAKTFSPGGAGIGEQDQINIIIATPTPGNPAKLPRFAPNNQALSTKLIKRSAVWIPAQLIFGHM
jgi:hypothetical protein